MKVLGSLVFVGLLFTPLTGFAQNYGIKDFGAVADNQTLNTAAIQRAIDRCAAAGGSEVLVPAGAFVTGSLMLKSDVSLRLGPTDLAALET